MNIRHIPKLIAIFASATFLAYAIAQNADPNAPPAAPATPAEPAVPALAQPGEGNGASLVIEKATAEAEKARAEAEKARAEAEKVRLRPLAPVDDKDDGKGVTFGKGFPFNSSSIHISDGERQKSEDERILELLFPVMIVAIVFACPVFLIALILGYRVWKNRQLHKTIQTLVEKGQPIPQELLSTSGKSLGSKPPPTNKSDRRKGIIWTCVGGGLTMFFLLSDGPKGLGFIPLAIGIGYLLVAKFAPRGPDEP